METWQGVATVIHGAIAVAGLVLVGSGLALLRIAVKFFW